MDQREEKDEGRIDLTKDPVDIDEVEQFLLGGMTEDVLYHTVRRDSMRFKLHRVSVPQQPDAESPDRVLR